MGYSKSALSAEKIAGPASRSQLSHMPEKCQDQTSNPDGFLDVLRCKLSQQHGVACPHSVDRFNNCGSQGPDKNLSDMQSVANLSDAMQRRPLIRLDHLHCHKSYRTDHGAMAINTRHAPSGSSSNISTCSMLLLRSAAATPTCT